MMTPKRLAAYFPVGAAEFNYRVANIPANRLTHLIYAFAGISATGECVSERPPQDRINFPALRKRGARRYRHRSRIPKSQGIQWFSSRRSAAIDTFAVYGWRTKLSLSRKRE
jgi:GH18 family chitinase